MLLYVRVINSLREVILTNIHAESGALRRRKIIYGKEIPMMTEPIFSQTEYFFAPSKMFTLLFQPSGMIE